MQKWITLNKDTLLETRNQGPDEAVGIYLNFRDIIFINEAIEANYGITFDPCVFDCYIPPSHKRIFTVKTNIRKTADNCLQPYNREQVLLLPSLPGISVILG